MGFDGGNIIQDAHMDDTLYVKNPDASDLLLEDPVDKERGEKDMNVDFDAVRGDGFANDMGDFGTCVNVLILTSCSQVLNLVMSQFYRQQAASIVTNGNILYAFGITRLVIVTMHVCRIVYK